MTARTHGARRRQAAAKLSTNIGGVDHLLITAFLFTGTQRAGHAR